MFPRQVNEESESLRPAITLLVRDRLRQSTLTEGLECGPTQAGCRPHSEICLGEGSTIQRSVYRSVLMLVEQGAGGTRTAAMPSTPGILLSVCRYSVAENIHTLGDGEVLRDQLELASRVVLLNADGFEEQCLSFHMNIEGRQLPVAWRNLRLPDFEGTALINVSEQAPAKFHRMDEVT